MLQDHKIDLIPATLDNRQEIYDWCFHSETTKWHSGPPNFPQIPIPTYLDFCNDYYEDYFFTGHKPKNGRGFIIQCDGKPIGFISYSSFHLKQGLAELDIWMSCEANCGKGFGVTAITALGNLLHKTININKLIIAPASKNKSAIRSYEKAGFKKTTIAMTDFLIDEYISLYGNGDYGTKETTILIKNLNM